MRPLEVPVLDQRLKPGVPAGAELTAGVADLVDEYAAYALRVRSLEEETVKAQRLYLERFLASAPGSSPAELLGALTPGRVRRFIMAYAESHGRGSRQWMQMTLRSFLRFCYQRGHLPCDLSGAVPAFRSRRLASVPKGIDDGTVTRLLESLDRESPVAVRDLAIIELLATYGVRGIQVRQLRLDDIEWTENRIRFRPVKESVASARQSAREADPVFRRILRVFGETSRPKNSTECRHRGPRFSTSRVGQPCRVEVSSSKAGPCAQQRASSWGGGLTSSRQVASWTA